MRELVQVADGVGQADRVEQFGGPDVRPGLGPAVHQAQRFGEEVPDPAYRVDGGPGVLVDHRRFVGAHLAQARGGGADQVGAVHADPAADLGALREQAECGAGGDGLAGAGFADQGDDLAGRDGEADPVEEGRAIAGRVTRRAW